MLPHPLDTTALTEPIDRAALRAYRVGLPASVRPGIGMIVLGAVLMAVAPMPLLLIAGTLDGRPLFDGVLESIVFSAPFLALLIAGGALVVITSLRRSGRRQFRLQRFATANGWRYDPIVLRPQLPGALFQSGVRTQARDLLRGDGRPTVGGYRWTPAPERSNREQRWSFVELPLPAPLPHIVLDARGNDSLLRGGLPVDYERSQRLRLEGDFDRYFTLHCPVGYEADALYLFTPDVMARFIDHAAVLDVEIIDDRLFLYARRDLVSTDPATWIWLASVIDALTEKVDRWERWRDDRLPPQPGATALILPPRGVAQPGRRLVHRQRWLGFVLFCCLSLIGLWLWVRDMIATVLG